MGTEGIHLIFGDSVDRDCAAICQEFRLGNHCITEVFGASFAEVPFDVESVIAESFTEQFV